MRLSSLAIHTAIGETPEVHSGTDYTENLFSSQKTCLCFRRVRVNLNESLAWESLNGNKQNRDDYTYTHRVLASIKVQGILNSHHLTCGDKENPGKEITGYLQLLQKKLT